MKSASRHITKPVTRWLPRWSKARIRCTKSRSFRAAWRLGVTQQLPVDDRHTYPRLYLEGQLAIMMGGRLAEELFLETMTTGAGNDIEQATELARKMVCQFGMSSLGPLTFGKQEEQIFLGREIAQHRDYSEHTAVAIDGEVRKFVHAGLRAGEKHPDRKSGSADSDCGSAARTRIARCG